MSRNMKQCAALGLAVAGWCAWPWCAGFVAYLFGGSY